VAAAAAKGEKLEIPRPIPFWDAPLKYPSKGELSPLEQRQFDFAKKIREETVRRLRAEQGASKSPAVSTGR
jgi:hypothetical protein